MRRALARTALAAAVLSAAPALAVYKCRAPEGSLTYQELPCAGSEQALEARIPSDFPVPNLAERDRTLQREAALDRRLEAQRDRLTAESIARISRPEPVAAPVEPAAVVWWPAAYPTLRGIHRPQPRNAMREWSSGRLR